MLYNIWLKSAVWSIDRLDIVDWWSLSDRAMQDTLRDEPGMISVLLTIVRNLLILFIANYWITNKILMLYKQRIF
jgi:hypothetical protein